MKGLKQLIFEKEKELQSLEDSLGLDFPIVEQAKMTQISHLRLELEDLRQIEKSIHLNDNQQIVLEQLKINAGSEGSLTKAIHSLFNSLSISPVRLEKDGAADLVVIDDVGSELGKDASDSRAFGINTLNSFLDARQNLATVITTNLLGEELKEAYGMRTTSRIFVNSDGFTMVFSQTTDKRLKPVKGAIA